MAGRKTNLKYIFDLDHTLYRYPEDVVERYNRACVKAALVMGAALSQDDAMRLAARSYAETGRQISYFVRDHALEDAALTKLTNHFALQEFRGAIRMDTRLRDAFNSVAAKDKVILTHSTREWTLTVLKELDMLRTTLPENILTIDHPDIAGARKERSEKPFRAALARLAAMPSEAVMADDLAVNLDIPHRMGIQTAQVTWGAGDDRLGPKPRHVDRRVQDITQVIGTGMRRRPEDPAP